MRLVYPEQREGVSPDELYRVSRPRPATRPWVAMVMISSLDGSIVLAGRAGGLGGPGDREVFATLRAAADVIVVGSATAAIERYGPTATAGQRIGVVSRSGAIAPAADLWRSGAGFLIMPDDSPPPPAGIDVVRTGTGAVDIAAALRQLDTVSDTAVDFVLVEGGATLNGSVLASGCVDELDLTVAPLLVGGTGPRLAASADEHLTTMRPAHIATDDDGYVYTRYLAARDGHEAR